MGRWAAGKAVEQTIAQRQAINWHHGAAAGGNGIMAWRKAAARASSISRSATAPEA